MSVHLFFKYFYLFFLVIHFGLFIFMYDNCVAINLNAIINKYKSVLENLQENVFYWSAVSIFFFLTCKSFNLYITVVLY